MNVITIEDSFGGLSADIYPEHGGMVGRLKIDGVNVLRIDESKLGLANVLAGGIPILFPFSGRTQNNRYKLNGKSYHMPMHGFVKDIPFAVEEITDNSTTLWTDNSDSLMKGTYPFKFKFKVKYSVVRGTLRIEATVINESEQDMPHSMGWHPYFAVSDKKALEFSQNYQRHYDYINCRFHKHNKPIDLTERLDNVYCDPLDYSFALINKADGYGVTLSFDEVYKTLVVYTENHDSICLEPWIGIPDSINRNEYISYVKPNSSETYNLNIEVERI